MQTAYMSEEQITRGARTCPYCRAEITKASLFRAGALFSPETLKQDDDFELLDRKPAITGPSQPSPKRALVSGTASPHLMIIEGQSDAIDCKPTVKRVKTESRGSIHEPIEILDDDEVEHPEIPRGIDDVVPSTKMVKMGERCLHVCGSNTRRTDRAMAYRRS